MRRVTSRIVCELGKMATTTMQDCEDYVEQKGIQGILKECIAKICQERPDNPYKWFREYFEKLEKVGGREGMEECECVCVWFTMGLQWVY